jgi:hypothetical protein
MTGSWQSTQGDKMKMHKEEEHNDTVEGQTQGLRGKVGGGWRTENMGEEGQTGRNGRGKGVQKDKRNRRQVMMWLEGDKGRVKGMKSAAGGLKAWLENPIIQNPTKE